jgi:hypothetical protein
LTLQKDLEMRGHCFLPLAVFVLVAFGCSRRTEPVHITTKQWEPGTKARFDVWVSDSALIGDSAMSKPSDHCQVVITVKDESDSGATIDWQQFLDSRVAGVFDIPAIHLVYRTTPVGRFKALLNYNEVYAYADTMTTLYLRGMRLDSGTISAARAWGLDSLNLTNTLSRNVRIFHRAFGALVDPSRYGDTVGWSGLDLFDQQPMHAIVDLQGTCAGANAVAIRMWDEPTEWEADDGSVADWDHLAEHGDSLGREIFEKSKKALVSDSLLVCVDIDRCLPSFLRQVTVHRTQLGMARRYLTISEIAK